MGNEQTAIELTLPLRAEYVSVARLTVSGIANRIGFDIETIEDIKVAVAEVCNKIIRGSNSKEGKYKITFNILTDGLEILFDCSGSNINCLFDSDDDILEISIIEALMDELKILKNEPYILAMSKILERDR